jgi:hypothetical protein
MITDYHKKEQERYDAQLQGKTQTTLHDTIEADLVNPVVRNFGTLGRPATSEDLEKKQEDIVQVVNEINRLDIIIRDAPKRLKELEIIKDTQKLKRLSPEWMTFQTPITNLTREMRTAKTTMSKLEQQLTDLETVGKLGFVEGITNIIIKNLKALDIYKRPVHCSDSKREVVYIKDENKWEKENEEKQKLRKAIKRVAYKNTKMLSIFREKHPDCGKSESKYSDQYNKLIIEAMGGKGVNDLEKENKIIKNIAKEMVIEKIGIE